MSIVIILLEVTHLAGGNPSQHKRTGEDDLLFQYKEMRNKVVSHIHDIDAKLASEKNQTNDILSNCNTVS